MIGYIQSWLRASQAAASEIQLTPVPAVSPSGSQVFPPFGDLSGSQVSNLTNAAPPGLLYLLNTHCSDCHSDTATIPQSPFFASDNPQVAYDAARTKVDFKQSRQLTIGAAVA